MVGTMKKYLLFATIAATLGSGIVWARFLHDNSYEKCVLDNMPGTKSDAIASVILQACRDMTVDKPQASSQAKLQPPSKERQDYNLCILNNLRGDESAVAVNHIIEACKQLNLH